MLLAEELSQAFRRHRKTLALAESCTGGAIAAALTAIPGASEFFLGSVVVYSNEWKRNFLGVTGLEKHGAVSRETVREMATHLLERGGSDFVAAVSGIAGPGGGTADKPVGTVWIAVGKRGGVVDEEVIHAQGDRKAIIEAATRAVLSAILRRL